MPGQVCLSSLLACGWRRVGGRESEQWRTGVELARQGDIANLRVVAIDIVSAPADGAPRCVSMMAGWFEGWPGDHLKSTRHT